MGRECISGVVDLIILAFADGLGRFGGGFRCAGNRGQCGKDSQKLSPSCRGMSQDYYFVP